MNNTAKIIIALAAGAVAGAVAGLLFAPAKGTDTRENLKRKGKKIAEDITSRFKAKATDASVAEESFN